jgi:hypothetical protein
VLYPIPHREYPRFPYGRPREPAPPVGMAVKGARDLPTLGYPLELAARSSARPSPSTGELVARRCLLRHACGSYGGAVTTVQGVASPTSTTVNGMACGHARSWRKTYPYLGPEIAPRLDHILLLHLFGPLSRWPPCTSPSTIKGDPWPPGKRDSDNGLHNGLHGRKTRFTHTHNRDLGARFPLSPACIHPDTSV